MNCAGAGNTGDRIRGAQTAQGTSYCAHQNAAEAAVVDGVSVYGATSLSEVVEFLRGERDLAPVPTQPWIVRKIQEESDFSANTMPEEQ